MKKILIKLCMMTIFIILAGTINAQINITLSPPIMEIATSPGAVKTFPLLLINNGEEDMNVRLYATDLILEREGKTSFPEKGTYKYSCAKWLEVSPKDTIIKGNETKQIMCKLSIPKGELGGRYAAVMVEILPKDTPQKGQVIFYRLASLLLVVIKGWGLESEAIIEDIQLTPKEKTAGYEIIASLKNKGNVHLEAKGEAILKNERGYRLRTEAITLEAGKGTVFPEGIRDFKGNFEKKLGDGIYIIDTKFTYQKRKEVSKSKRFEISKGKVKELKEELISTITKKEKTKIWVEPSFIDLISPAKGLRSSSILVRNEGMAKLEIEAFIKDYSINQEGKIIYLTAGSQFYSCANWIEINPSKFTLEPGQKRNILFVIRLPEDAKGGKYANIHFVGLNKDKEIETMTELPVSLEIPNTAIKKAELSDINYYQEKQADKKIIHYISFVFTNSGNIHLSPKGEVKIYKEKECVAKVPILEEQEFILPGGKRKMIVHFDQEIKKGDYYTEVEIDYGAKETICERKKFSIK